MNERPRSSGSSGKALPGGKSSGAASVIAKALPLTLLLAAVVVAASYDFTDGWAKLGDEVSPSQARMRLDAFRSLDSLVASKVADGDVDRALREMNLGPSALQSLRTELTRPDASSIKSQTAATEPGAAPPSAQPAVQTDAKPQRLQLVWIRLWDTDAEDGDVVRIDSAGYSRTVNLTKRGDTFAVPVAADGLVRVTGIKDGDGGGITVGLASGSSQAVFPIMSEGQVLGLRVRVN